MKTKNDKLSLLACALFAAGWQLPVHAETLTEAVQETIDASPEVGLDAARRRTAEEGVGVAKGGYLPKVDVLLGVGREYADNATTHNLFNGSQTMNRRERQVTLTQMLFDGFGTSSEVDRNKAITESAAYRVSGTSDTIALQAVQAYLEVLRLREVLGAAKANLAAHEKTYEQIKMRTQGGVSKKSDQDQIEARLALAQANVVAAEANLKDAETNYRKVIGKAPDAMSVPAEVEGAQLPQSIDAAVAKALESHPLMKSSVVDVAQAKAQNEAAKRFRYPTLHLEAGYSSNDNVAGQPGNEEDAYAMLRMRYNIFNGGSDEARVRQTQSQVYEANEIMFRTRRQVEQSTRLSYTAYLTAQERLPSLKQHMDSSNLTRDAYAKQFAIGQRTLLDVLDGENEYFTSSTDYINGFYVARYARYRVLADVGTLLPVLGVKPRDEAVPPYPGMDQYGADTSKDLQVVDGGAQAQTE